MAFSGYLPIAEQGYPLAECQIGYFYLEGRGVEKNVEKTSRILLMPVRYITIRSKPKPKPAWRQEP